MVRVRRSPRREESTGTCTRVHRGWPHPLVSSAGDESSLFRSRKDERKEREREIWRGCKGESERVGGAKRKVTIHTVKRVPRPNAGRLMSLV